MLAVTASSSTSRTDRWLLGAALALSILLLAGGYWRWPWDHDEVLSLAELGVVPADAYPGPLLQVQKIRVILPVWYYVQGAALSMLPANEFGARTMPVCAAVVLVLLSARWAVRRGRRFATAFVLTAGCSPMLVWLAQQNRFYPLALCLMAAALFVASSRAEGRGPDAGAAVLALGAVLTHNLTIVVFGIAFVAALATHWTSLPQPRLVRRTAVMSMVAGTAYLAYLRPVLAGWISGGTGGTSPLVSYFAQFGLWTAGLGLIGAWIILTRRDDPEMRWWLWMSAGSVLFVTLAPVALKAWNPRYALFFMWPAWVVASYGTAAVADRLEQGGLRAAWFGAVLLMMAPKLLSHEVDGTRHDFRSAAAVVRTHSDTIPVSNWPATLQYYLERTGGRQRVRDWQPGGRLPDGEVTLAFASNAWEPILAFPGRSTTVIGEVRSRRFDEQSHVIRIYSVGAQHQGAAR